MVWVKIYVLQPSTDTTSWWESSTHAGWTQQRMRNSNCPCPWNIFILQYFFHHPKSSFYPDSRIFRLSSLGRENFACFYMEVGKVFWNLLKPIENFQPRLNQLPISLQFGFDDIWREKRRRENASRDLEIRTDKKIEIQASGRKIFDRKKGEKCLDGKIWRKNWKFGFRRVETEENLKVSKGWKLKKIYKIKILNLNLIFLKIDSNSSHKNAPTTLKNSSFSLP